MPALERPWVTDQHFEVVVVGAGLAGLAAAVKLERAGITDFVVLEKADRVGGTWRENTYPGCGVDVPSPVYSFSFNPNPEWKHSFTLQPELLAYIEETVDKFGVGRYLQMGTELIESQWSDDDRRWTLDTGKGRITAQFVIFAAGPITEPTIPDIDGLDTFEGEIFHSSRWNHEYDLTGKKVAVIGTGASAVQFIPEITPKVEQLFVFQRTPSWVVPRPDLSFPPPVRSLFARLPLLQRGLREVLDVSLRTVTMALRRDRTAKLLNPIGLWHLARQVPDPELRQALTPDFTLGCKRLLLSNTYLPALSEPNVELVPHALAGAGKNYVVGADGVEHEVDAIIFGTGFDVSHPPIASRIRDRNGEVLAHRWKASPEAYLSTTVPDVPNAFIMLGPNILVYNSFLGLAESQLEYVIDAIRQARAGGIETLTVKSEPFRAFNDDVQRDLEPTVFNNGGCSSYYLDDNGKNYIAWPWSTGLLRRKLSRFDMENYATEKFGKATP